jgi:hypothetical protein
LNIQPVSAENRNDLETLFEGRGGPDYCWCMVWRNMQEGAGRQNKEAKKASLKKSEEKNPIGLLPYNGCVPVGWCSIAPRGDFRNLSGDESLENVWSLVCFYIKNEISADDRDQERKQFFSKGRACMRASALTKRYGWGVHNDADDKIAIYAMESDTYEQLVNDNNLKKLKAMRSSRR